MFTLAINASTFILTVLAIVALVVIHHSYNKRYKKKYKEFTNEVHKQYLVMLEKSKQQTMIDVMNLNNKELSKDGKCPYCGKRME